MVGIPSFGNAETIGYVVRATTAGMVQYFPELKPILVNSDGGSPDDTPRVAVSTESPDYLEKVILVSPKHKLQRISVTYQGTSGKGTAVRALFEVARELKVKAMVMVDSDLRSIVPEWVELLAGPILKGGYDFVAPLYARYKYDGTITNNISYPLTRALYGARIRQPIGGDFARLAATSSRATWSSTRSTSSTARFGIDIWMTHSAINEGFAVCQARLGAKIHDAKDPACDLGPMFRQVVGTLFKLAGHYEDRWLRVRGSHPIPEYGFERVVAPEEITVNHAKLVDNLEQARLAQQEVWSEMLAPEQLERVDGPRDRRRPGRLPLQRRAVDPLPLRQRSSRSTGPVPIASGCWPALTPLYFGRTAGFISDTLDMTTDQAERVIDDQARQFEELKPYLVARWTRRARAGRGGAADGAPRGARRRTGSSCRSRTRGRRATSCASAPASPTAGPPRSPRSASSRCPEGVSLSEGATQARTSRRLLQRVLDFGDEEGVELRTLVRIGRHASDGVIEAVGEEGRDLVIFGWGGPPTPSQAARAEAEATEMALAGERARPRPVFSPTIDAVVRESPCDIAVVKQRGLDQVRVDPGAGPRRTARRAGDAHQPRPRQAVRGEGRGAARRAEGRRRAGRSSASRPRSTRSCVSTPARDARPA